MTASGSTVSGSFLRAAVAASLLWVGSAFSARAATFVVNSTLDVVHGSCGATCSLRDAIIASNGTAGPNVITLPANPGNPYTLQIPGANEDNAATGDLDIKVSVTINGGGAADTIVSAAGLDRVFQIIGNINVTFNDVTIQGGNATGDGGGILAPAGNLTLNNCVVKNNFASGQGAGINATNLALNNSTVSFNTSTTNQGGGLFLINGTSTISGSTIGNNTANQEGGGIYLNGSINPAAPALLTISNSTFSFNQGAAGGGIFILSQATVTITGSTFTVNNTFTGGGGAINDAGATLSLTNCTLEENSITAGTTGGTAIFNNDGNVTVTNCTIDSNVMASGPGAGIASPGVAMNVKNTIVTNNSGGNCSGNITDGGGNIQGATDCGTMTQGAALLQVLNNNGGPTQTQALGAGSAALDHAVGCPPPSTDQRGFTRPQGAACDTGAFECQPTEPCFAVVATPTPTATQPGATATPTATATATRTPTSVPPTATSTPGVIGAAVVPTLSPPMLGLLVLALGAAALLLLKRSA